MMARTKVTLTELVDEKDLARLRAAGFRAVVRWEKIDTSTDGQGPEQYSHYPWDRHALPFVCTLKEALEHVDRIARRAARRSLRVRSAR